jgi:xylan 1,4-beta-xylosidase
MKYVLFFASLLGLGCTARLPKTTTFCNPLNLDYAYNPSAHKSFPAHRSTADPVIVNFKDEYWLFATNQEGYWQSADLLDWKFIKKDFYINVYGDNACAPAANPFGDTLLFLPSITDRDKSPLFGTTDPASAQWFTLTDSFEVAAWDPSFFTDDDGRLYLYWGSSNVFPIRGVELDPKNRFRPIGKPVDLLVLHPREHGWERFGENNTDTTIAPYFEGAWMDKHDGKYYLQYAAPGTEWNVYADGAYVGDKPLGPFTYQAYNPFSYKPGGFMTGAGHGSTFRDRHGNYWHAATGLAWIKNKFERRLGLYPAGFDADGQIYTNTAFGDYPQYVPRAKRNQLAGGFTGWMLLSCGKSATASSSLPDRGPAFAADENIRTYWSAATNAPGEWFQLDLGAVHTVRAVQVNYADEGVEVFDKQGPGFYHQYRILHSRDGKTWRTLVDKSQNRRDVPHDYVELPRAVRTRYVKIVNDRMPSGKFALSDLRVFGEAAGNPPAAVQNFRVERRADDPREAHFSWDGVSGADRYLIRYGIRPDKLYNSMMVTGANSYVFRGMDRGTRYFFTIEAVGETGISKRSATIEAAAR